MSTKVSTELRAMDGHTYIVGREGHIYLSHSSVSRQHAEIKIIDGRIHLRDLESSNGIFCLVDNRPVRFHEGFVEPQQPILIGNQQCTVQGLLAVLGIIEDHLDEPA